MATIEKDGSNPAFEAEKYPSKADYTTSSPSTGSDDDGNEDYVHKDKALLRKLDLKLLPALTLLYLLSFLDRSNGATFIPYRLSRDHV